MLSDDERKRRDRELHRGYSGAKREAINARQRRYNEANRDAINERQRRYNEANREAVNERERQRRLERRRKVFDHYGWICSCPGCEATVNLTIDHVDGSGRQHREDPRGPHASGAPTYSWLIKNGFPSGFQTLCKPCNGSKHNGEHCRLNHPEVAA